MKKDIERLIADIDTLSKRGRKTVRLQLLRSVLTSIVGSSPERNAKLEELHYQFTHEGKMAEWQESREVDRLLLNAAMTFGGNALRAITWMNGGAAVACLTYAANLKDKSLLPAMLLFAYGLLAGGVAHGAAYLAQYRYAEGSDKIGNRFRGICIFLVLLSYALFLAGTLSGYYGIEN